MRTLRLSLVGSVILAVFGGLGGPVIAQEGDDPEQALVGRPSVAPSLRRSSMTPTRSTG